MALLERADVFRRPERFAELLAAHEVLSGGNADAWRRAAQAARGVDAGAIAAAHRADPPGIPAAVRAARVAAVGAALADTGA